MLSHLKRRMGVFTAVAVMAALVPVLSTSTASAAPSTTPVAPGDMAKLYSACPASANIPSAGFTDTTSTDVDCIKYYGITTGVTATTYEPDSSIPRWAMALYLTRMATETGVTLGDGSDQGFTDISGKSAEIQTAINQLMQLGVTTGTTSTTYSPDDNVTREQMAMFMNRLLSNVTGGPNASTDTATTPTKVNGGTVTYNYLDIDSGSVTYEGHNSIVEVYNLGIPGHTSANTAFGPTADIPRSEMATWISNALGHTNLRPSGLVIQATETSGYGALNASTNELHVSHRDANFDAVADTIVDVFGFTSTLVLNESALASTGACKDALETSTGAEELCLIENTDYVTDQSGNIEIAGNAINAGVDVDEGETTQFWAWTAAVGTYFSSAQTASTVTVASSAAGDFVNVTSSHPYANVLTGQTPNTGVTGVDVWEARMAFPVTLTLQLRSTGAGSTALTNVSQAGCLIDVQLHEANSAYGTTSAITNSTLTTDANGQATYEASRPEVTAGDGSALDTQEGMTVIFSNNAYNGVTNTCGTVGGITYGSVVSAADTDGFSFSWDDTARDNNSVVASASSNYVRASAVSTGATNTITGTSYDQYGVGVASDSLGLEVSQVGSGTPTFTVTRTTNSSGVATFGVTRDDATSARSTWRVNNDESTTTSVDSVWTVVPSSTAIDASVGANSATATLVPTRDYTGTAADNAIEFQIIQADVANDTMIVEVVAYDDVATASTTQFVEYTWDSNDSFANTGAAQTQAQWESSTTGIGGVALTTAAVDGYDGTNNGKLSEVADGYASEWRIP